LEDAMDKPFWERTYRDDSVTTFGINPNRAVEAMWETFGKNWAILEVGCGEGKNSIFLAEKGFVDIDAFDLSIAGIDKLQRIAQLKDLRINAWVQDFTTFTFQKTYDVIISYGAFHFVEKEKWVKFISDAKRYTNVGGLNIFQIFTNKVPASKDIAPYVKGLSDEGDLESLYTDWNIVKLDAHVFEDEHPGVEKHWHASNTIVARKKIAGDKLIDLF
jgi:cyclopropane fatty-acyl-phospholipid synthase-like methyltransferase